MIKHALKLILFILLSCAGKEFKRDYYPSGELKSEFEIRDGDFNGIGRLFHENGKVSYEGNYIKGKRQGWHIHYARNGKISHKGLYDVVDGEERIIKRVKMGDGYVESETTFAEKNIKVEYNQVRVYSVGDTLRVKLKMLDGKYTYCEAVLGHFDKYLNMLKDAPFPPQFVEGNLEHEVVMRILLEKPGKHALTGLFRDFEYYPMTDSTGRVVGEDSFFSFEVDVKP